MVSKSLSQHLNDIFVIFFWISLTIILNIFDVFFMHQCRYVTKCNLRHEQFSTLCEPLASYTKLVHCNRHVNHPLLIGTSRTYLSCIGESSAAGQPAAMHDRQRITRLTIEYYSFIILFFLLFSFIVFFRSISSTYLFSRFFFYFELLIVSIIILNYVKLDTLIK